MTRSGFRYCASSATRQRSQAMLCARKAEELTLRLCYKVLSPLQKKRSDFDCVCIQLGFVLRSKAPFTEPTPNRGQRLLADYAEVRRRKSKGQRSKGVWGIGNTLVSPRYKKRSDENHSFFVAGERLELSTS